MYDILDGHLIFHVDSLTSLFLNFQKYDSGVRQCPEIREIKCPLHALKARFLWNYWEVRSQLLQLPAASSCSIRNPTLGPPGLAVPRTQLQALRLLAPRGRMQLGAPARGPQAAAARASNLGGASAEQVPRLSQRSEGTMKRKRGLLSTAPHGADFAPPGCLRPGGNCEGGGAGPLPSRTRAGQGPSQAQAPGGADPEQAAQAFRIRSSPSHLPEYPEMVCHICFQPTKSPSKLGFF